MQLGSCLGRSSADPVDGVLDQAAITSMGVCGRAVSQLYIDDPRLSILMRPGDDRITLGVGYLQKLRDSWIDIESLIGLVVDFEVSEASGNRMEPIEDLNGQPLVMEELSGTVFDSPFKPLRQVIGPPRIRRNSGQS
jgi:hypothetical protein